MHIQLNPKNFFVLTFVLFFIYLAYLIWGGNDYYPELNVDLRDLISYTVLSVEMGGHAVAKIYAENNLNIKKKGDTDVGKAELLTRADLVSNHIILGLLQRFPLIKVVTEEKSESMPEKEVERYKNDNYVFWLNVRQALEMFPSQKLSLHRVTIWVDPLDATQEFSEGLTQYVTVMACIVVDGSPVFGAIYRPFSNETILGMVGFGLLDSTGKRVKVKPENQIKKNIVVSRSHAGSVKELAEKAFNKDEYNVVAVGGSGFKTLELINGNAEIYIHTTAIKKWDICAGDALIRAAGGSLIDLKGRPINYNAGGSELHKEGLLMSINVPFTKLAKIKNYLPTKI